MRAVTRTPAKRRRQCESVVQCVPWHSEQQCDVGRRYTDRLAPHRRYTHRDAAAVTGRGHPRRARQRREEARRGRPPSAHGGTHATTRRRVPSQSRCAKPVPDLTDTRSLLARAIRCIVHPWRRGSGGGGGSFRFLPSGDRVAAERTCLLACVARRAGVRSSWLLSEGGGAGSPVCLKLGRLASSAAGTRLDAHPVRANRPTSRLPQPHVRAG